MEELEKKITAHFSDIKMPENPKKRENHDLPNHKETFISVASDKEAPFSMIQLMYKDREEARKTKTYGDYREDIVKRLFSTMLNNRLGDLRNKPNPPFVFAGSNYGGTFARTKNAFQSFAYASPDGQLNALKVILQENKRVQQHGFLLSELDRAIKSVLAGNGKSIQRQRQNGKWPNFRRIHSKLLG